MKTKSALLGELFGGKWHYNGTTTWHCDDGKRSVSRRVRDVHDENSLVSYWLYGDGTPYCIDQQLGYSPRNFSSLVHHQNNQ